MAQVTVFRGNAGTLTEAFEELFREHHALIFRSAYSITGNAQDAEDVLQTIFLRLLRRGITPDLQKNPKGYLYRAAVNVALSILRSRRETATIEQEPFETPAALVEPRVSDESRKALVNAMAQLKPGAIEILVLHYEHDYSDAEIARILGTSRGTVAVILYRTRARLRKLMHVDLEKRS